MQRAFLAPRNMNIRTKIFTIAVDKSYESVLWKLNDF